jgi:succinate dehydrogenase hydrophobic anchor subunit
MLEIRLYLAQRISAAIMAPLVLLHLGLMIYAIQGGLDASESWRAPAVACSGGVAMPCLC